MNILVTGGAGYIGSHIVKLLGKTTKNNITVIDNLSTGVKSSVLYGDLIIVDLSDTARIKKIFKNRNFDAIFHFAASIVVPESIKNPLQYYSNNTINTINLIKIAVENNVNFFVFSSTAAVYGIPKKLPISESALKNPINPYGMSKLMSENIIKDTAKAFKNFNYINLRYFNVAGASPDGKIGQSTPKATHLIKLASKTAIGERDKLEIFGTDYDTPDGTCIRDYIHVVDLAKAHISALEYLKNGNKSDTFNCGYGKGFSVKQVIETMKKVSEVDFPVKESGRRPGDPPVLVADNTKILKNLDWIPEYNKLEFICKTAFDWEKKISKSSKQKSNIINKQKSKS